MKGIYLIKNNVNKNIYIGSSNNITRRWREHKSAALNINNRNYEYPIYRAIRKYGIDNFSLEILEQVEEDKELIKKEVYWFNKLKPYYNQIEPVKAPTFNSHHTEKSKQKISQNNGRYWKDKKLPKDMIDNIIKGNKNKRKYIFMKDIDGNILKEFDGYCNALRYLNKNPNNTDNIKRCCLDENKTAYGYKWSFK